MNNFNSRLDAVVGTVTELKTRLDISQKDTTEFKASLELSQKDIDELKPCKTKLAVLFKKLILALIFRFGVILFGILKWT